MVSRFNLETPFRYERKAVANMKTVIVANMRER
jgi:hypothetical protein